MSLRIPSGYVEAWMSFTVTGDNEPMYVSLGADVDGLVFPNQTDTDALLTVLRDRLKPLCTTEYSVGPGHVLWGGGPNPDVRIDGTNAPVLGTRTPPANPNNCATLVQKRTEAGGRRGRGRMFVPGVAEGDTDAAGNLASVARTAWQTQMTGLVTDVAALTNFTGLVLLHDTAPFDPNPITALTVAPKIATQRKRMRR